MGAVKVIAAGLDVIKVGLGLIGVGGDLETGVAAV
jgi:hypothetical protein